MLTSTMKPKFRSERFSRSKSLMPTEKPMPMMGPMSGEISMAPMMTAVELTLSPNEATNVAKMSTHRFMPRNSAPRQMFSSTSRWSAPSACKSNRSWRKRPNACHEKPRCAVLSIDFPCFSIRLP